jgi:hypothetical protein
MNAVQILVERLKTHPEEFFGEPKDLRTYRPMEKYEAKFRNEALQIERHIIGARDKDDSSYDAYWYLTQEEKDALRVAYTEARRARFEADIIHVLLAPPESEAKRKNVQVLTASSIANQALNIMEDEFDKSYNNPLIYNAENRYNRK